MAELYRYYQEMKIRAWISWKLAQVAQWLLRLAHRITPEGR